MNDRLLSFLGLCLRAKKLVIGAEISAKSAQEGKSKLILYADDFSPNSLKKLLAAAQQYGVRAMSVHRTKQELSLALGRLSGAISVEDEGFAKKLIEMIESEQGGELYDKI
ncbi:MAG: ribosomal L7Ae/L30e/S12e/Gadd45 family protein [Ruminococcus sp.]|nr:ribosomal L7Ae/L30e/S12e/Gadd45 family protein [Ruminococcus sp.]